MVVKQVTKIEGHVPLQSLPKPVPIEDRAVPRYRTAARPAQHWRAYIARDKPIARNLSKRRGLVRSVSKRTIAVCASANGPEWTGGRVISCRCAERRPAPGRA